MGLVALGDTAGSSHTADSRVSIINVGLLEFRRDLKMIISSPTFLVQSYTWNACLKED